MSNPAQIWSAISSGLSGPLAATAASLAGLNPWLVFAIFMLGMLPTLLRAWGDFSIKRAAAGMIKKNEDTSSQEVLIAALGAHRTTAPEAAGTPPPTEPGAPALPPPRPAPPPDTGPQGAVDDSAP